MAALRLCQQWHQVIQNIQRSKMLTIVMFRVSAEKECGSVKKLRYALFFDYHTCPSGFNPFPFHTILLPWSYFIPNHCIPSHSLPPYSISIHHPSVYSYFLFWLQLFCSILFYIFTIQFNLKTIHLTKLAHYIYNNNFVTFLSWYVYKKDI